MAKYKFTCDLSRKGDLTKLINDLKDYRDKLDERLDKFLNSVMDRGIRVAELNTGLVVSPTQRGDGVDSFDAKGLISFSKEIRNENGKKVCVLLAVDTQKIIHRWENKNGVHEASISPLLMAEFGAGKYAENPMNVEGVGRGSLGSNGLKNGWYWYDPDVLDKDGKPTLFYSEGMMPTQPMYMASQEIARAVQEGINNM